MRTSLRLSCWPTVSRPSRPFLVVLYCLAGLCFAGMLSCASADQPLSLPDQIGAWTRSEEAPIAAEAFPAALQRLEVVAGAKATYRKGTTLVQASVYQLPSATSAFEAVQTYARQADEYYFQKGSSFVVVNLKELPMDARRSFLLALQTAITPDGPEKPKD